MQDLAELRRCRNYISGEPACERATSYVEVLYGYDLLRVSRGLAPLSGLRLCDLDLEQPRYCFLVCAECADDANAATGIAQPTLSGREWAMCTDDELLTVMQRHALYFYDKAGQRVVLSAHNRDLACCVSWVVVDAERGLVTQWERISYQRAFHRFLRFNSSEYGFLFY
jgi:hypothetical protein